MTADGNNNGSLPLIKRFGLDRALQVSILAVLLTALTVAGGSISSLLSIYNDLQKQLYELRTANALMSSKTDNIEKNLRSLGDTLTQSNIAQEKKDDGLRKSLDTISDDFKKYLYSRSGGRSQLLQRGWSGDCCWPDPGFQSPPEHIRTETDPAPTAH